VQSGRRAQLEALFSAHAGAVRAYARRRTDAWLAEDAVSEVFVIAWRRLEEIPEDSLPWLIGCARNVLAHQRRRRQRDAALVQRLSSTTPAENALSADHGLRDALGRLSDRDREVLLLIAWEELTPSQAARVLGCSRNALGVRLHRARRRLAAALAEADAEAAPRVTFCRPTKEARR
jgi:RNA polymerase sigma-70 factor (ECF subfamily)